ncbi:hypothetical protein P8C59_007679 [Phyllachora maydis]|uniref:Uncharacterized protein n=1 Tax=Phyllachora maydis TaxID=1825666 RepID=A0AAD9I977_9PEZI|nr:hypothetical protein P8C59_007679 [Phyllachora maydis]
MPLALAPILTKLAKITLAVRCVAACKAKRRKAAKAYAIAAKKEGLRHSKRTAGGDAGRYTTDSGLIADKDDNNAYNRVYMPFTDAEEEEEEDSSGNDNSINGGTSDSADKGEGSSMYKRGKGSSDYKVRPIIARYLKVLMAFEPAST